jgi:hypothetical protein
MRRRLRFLPLLFALVLAVVAAGCGGDGDDEADDDPIIPTADGDTEAGSGGDDGSSGGGTPAGDLQVVWPLPDADYDVFVAYQLIDDEFQYAESASFITEDLTMDDVLDFYRDFFPTIGLIPNEIELGESIAMNLTNPDDSGWSGVMQVGLDPAGPVIVNQNYSDLKDDAGGSASDGADGGGADGGGASSSGAADGG